MGWTFYSASGQRLSTAATSITNLDIDGATDIGAAIVDADLFIIDDGAGGTNRKTAASRIKTYVGGAYDQAAGAYHDAAQVIGSGAFQSCALNSERFDTDAIHDPSTNNSRLTCKTAGVYIITGTLYTGADSMLQFSFRIFLNNSTAIAWQSEIKDSSADDANITIATIRKLDVDDYVEIQGMASGGFAVTEVEFGMAKIAVG